MMLEHLKKPTTRTVTMVALFVLMAVQLELQVFTFNDQLRQYFLDPAGDGGVHLMNDSSLDTFSFPLQPPPDRSSSSCRVKFKDPNMQLCHLIPWGANFGDELGPAITKRILQYHWPCSTDDLPVLNLVNRTMNEVYRNQSAQCLFTVGSVMFLSAPGDHFWGTGRQPRFRSINCVENQPLYFHSVRGPSSRRFLQDRCGTFYENTTLEPAGDPGFLVPFLFPEYNTYNPQKAKHPFCLIPHHKDEEDSRLAVLAGEGAKILSVGRHWQDMVNDLLDCQFVLSSSLHGVILADAFGIPNKLWQSLEHKNKYIDYYNSFGIWGINLTDTHTYEQSAIRNLTSAFATNKSATIQDAVDQILPLDLRQRYSRHILKTFPWELFELVELS